MMWLRQAVGYGEPEQPRVSPIENNPVGWSSIYPPQVVTNPDPNVSPVVPKATMTPQALWGALLAGKRNQPVTGAELPALEQKANTAVNYGMAVAGATQPIRAFHGSPHTFDRFSLDKIGTGEGAQAYGHGLYFAGNEGVARFYRDALTPQPTLAPNMTFGGKTLEQLLPNTPDAVRKLIAGGVGMAGGDVDKAISTWAARSTPLSRMAAEAASSLRGLVVEMPKPTGSMYEVNLRTSPERLLDWDKPLSAPNNRALLQALEDTGKPVMPGDNASGGYWTLSERLRPRGAPDIAGVTAANDALRNAGLDGIQYLDAGSRAAGDGTRNYVMFRDDIIDILKRYGLFGLGMMGAAGAQGGKEQ